MDAQAKLFIERDDVRRALGQLFDECAVDAGEAGELPSLDAASFLRERGIEPPSQTPITVHRSVREGEAEAAPSRETVRVCGDNDDKWAYEKCEFKNGKEVCHWVCV